MAGSRVLIPRVRRLGTLVVIAAITTALSGVTPATAGGKPTPLAPSERSAAAAGRQVAEALAANPGSQRISATSVLRAASGYCTVRLWGTTSCKTETIRANPTYHTINVRACAPDSHYADWQVKDANNGVIVGQGRAAAGSCSSRTIGGLYGSYWGWVFNTRTGASMYINNG